MLYVILCNEIDMMLGNIVKRIEELSYMHCRNNAAYCVSQWKMQ